MDRSQKLITLWRSPHIHGSFMNYNGIPSQQHFPIHPNTLLLCRIPTKKARNVKHSVTGKKKASSQCAKYKRYQKCVNVFIKYCVIGVIEVITPHQVVYDLPNLSNIGNNFFYFFNMTYVSK